ncbi:ATPase [Synergistales bacterium]|nr:ATPase [Synergistales bacterium]
MSRSSYGYAVSRIRAMEHLLLDVGLFQRMLDVDDLTGALKILGETVYGRNIDANTGERYDGALEAELLSLYDDMRTFVPDEGLIDICRLSYDFHNVKVILKSAINARNGGKKRWDLLTKLGTIDTDNLIVQLESEDYPLLRYGLSSLIPACMTQWDQTRDIVEVERMLDEGLFAAMSLVAAEIGEPGVIAWVSARIDAENIRNLLRLKRFGFDAAKAAAFMHKGGTVTPDALIQLLPEQFDSWGRMIGYTNVGAAIAKVQDDGDFDDLMVSLEKALDDYCRDVLSNARYSANAPENVLAYIWGKEMEVKNIRTVLVSKGAGGDREATRRMLRHGY